MVIRINSKLDYTTVKNYRIVKVNVLRYVGVAVNNNNMHKEINKCIALWNLKTYIKDLLHMQANPGYWLKEIGDIWLLSKERYYEICNTEVKIYERRNHQDLKSFIRG